MIEENVMTLKNSIFIKTKSKYAGILYFTTVLLIVVSTFFTVLFQAPFFVTHNFNSFVSFFWLVCLIPLLLINYKLFLKNLFSIMIFLLPFLLYLFIALLFNTPSLSSSLTRTIILSVLITFVGLNLKPLFTIRHIAILSCIYSLATLLLGAIIFVQYLWGYDLSNQIYAYSSKNSAGPILFCGILTSHYYLKSCIFLKKKLITIPIDFCIYFYLSIIIALMKCRTVIVLIPFIFVFIFFDWFKNKYARIVFLLVIISTIIIIFAVPPIRDTLILKIFLNNKTDNLLSTLFSGRIESIIIAFQNFNFLLGDGKTYVDCMPIAILCSYGVIGCLSLISFVYLLIRLSKNQFFFSKNEKNLYVWMLIMFLLDSLMEGFGIFGPGAKVFIFWLFLGINSDASIVLRFESKKLFVDINTIFERLFSKKFFEQAFLWSLFSIIIIGGSFIVFYKPSTNFISTNIYELIPSKSKSIDYVLPEKIVLDVPETMAFGQQLKFSANVYPENATDKEITWQAYNKDIIDVDPESGISTSKNIGSVTIAASSLRQKNLYAEKVVHIVAPENYVFDQFIISSKPDDFSNYDYQHELPTNKTMKLYYDTSYCPQGTDVTFLVDNPEVCSVDDNGILRCLKKGSATIQGRLTTFTNEYYSLNCIKINVLDDYVSPPTSIDFNIEGIVYEKDVVNFNPVFSNGNNACDDSFYVEHSDNVSIDYDNKTIRCTRNGPAFLNIISTSNENLRKCIEFTIEDILPVKFICNDKWWELGETKRVDIDLLYDNGATHEVTLSDVVHSAREYENRAYYNKNGIANDYLTRAAITTSNISIRLKAAKNPEITCSFSIRVSQYSLAEYQHRVYLTSIILCNLIISLSILVIFSIKQPSRIVKAVIVLLLSLFINVMNAILFHNFLVVLISIPHIILIICLAGILKKLNLESIVLLNTQYVSIRQNTNNSNFYEVSI